MRHFVFCATSKCDMIMSPVDTAAAGVDRNVPHGPHGPGGLVSVRHHHPRLHLFAGEVL